MREVKIGIIGLGGMARYHIEQFGKVQGLRIIALCDVSTQALQEIGDQLGIDEARRYQSSEALIADSEVDGVVSVTPNNAHAGILKACIAAGKPLYAEKPLTRTYEEAVEVLELYQRNPIPCIINFSYRNGAAFQYVKQLVQGGKVGRVNHIFVQYLQEWGAPPSRTPFVWRFDESITGTGTLGDLGSHMIDLSQYVLGERISELQAMLTTIIPERPDPLTGLPVKVNVDDFACFNARFSNGTVGVFQTSRNAIGSGNQHELTIYGDAGTLHVSTLNDKQLIWTYAKDGEPGTVTETIEVPSEHALNPWQSFTDLISGKESAEFASLEDGFNNQAVLEAVLRASKSGTVVSVASL
ncbi:oxidoreductase [Paenibacillus baekrokdamisoli]|uniref:Oxidoreductase n=1 Tax=Paenibacillus baekrokdamisoli TaxID=1712516 RepID=A0A3G9J058_9BACL|nr:Gfo/Idh/MocA family oxidoreductase [Paenibacillus baekrokdamisoli]MBB3071388.1 putative dehydrogenase [Paenibacillus baekrokdamisoli]BBH24577.1 oxidoreductase [Paenibacillus baekrokdamisoli]